MVSQKNRTPYHHKVAQGRSERGEIFLILKEDNGKALRRNGKK